MNSPFLLLPSNGVILVPAAPPDAGLVTALWGAVEPLVHSPQAVQSARIRGIIVVDDAVFEHERAHAWPLARVSGHIGSGHRRVDSDRLRHRRGIHRVAAPFVVGFDVPIT